MSVQQWSCRECGKWHSLPKPPDPRKVTCTCGSVYMQYPDRVHHAAWGPNHTGPQRLDLRRLPPIINGAKILPPLPRKELSK